MMRRMTPAKMPMGLKMPKPKAEIDAIPAARKPMPTAGGKDIISITTRMRETPAKKAK
jgi:hypothetical protein